MQNLAVTDPELVSAAWEALGPIDPVGPELARETEFTYRGESFWTKMTIDPHANIIERWDVIPSELVHHRW